MSFLPAPAFSPHAAMSPYFIERRPAGDGPWSTPCEKFTGPPAMKCGIEWDEWMLVHALVHPNDTVLELGARFGTTSCALAAATRNSGHVVAVEPDKTVLTHLLGNRDRQQCAFAVLSGVVGSSPMFMTPSGQPDGYSSTAGSQRVNNQSVKVLAMPLETMEARLGRRFDVILIDCEGCIKSALTLQLAHINLLLWEEDGPMPWASPPERQRVYDRLVSNGFRLHWRSRDTFDRSQKWSRIMVHSAWVRIGSARDGNALPLCHEYKRIRGLPDRLLQCLDVNLAHTRHTVQGLPGIHEAGNPSPRLIS